MEKTKIMKISRQPSLIQIMINLKKLVDVEYFKYLDSVIKNDARSSCEIKFRISMANSSQQEDGSFHQQIGLKF